MYTKHEKSLRPLPVRRLTVPPEMISVNTRHTHRVGTIPRRTPQRILLPSCPSQGPLGQCSSADTGLAGGPRIAARMAACKVKVRTIRGRQKGENLTSWYRRPSTATTPQRNRRSVLKASLRGLGHSDQDAGARRTRHPQEVDALELLTPVLIGVTAVLGGFAFGLTIFVLCRCRHPLGKTQGRALLMPTREIVTNATEGEQI